LKSWEDEEEDAGSYWMTFDENRRCCKFKEEEHEIALCGELAFAETCGAVARQAA